MADVDEGRGTAGPTPEPAAIFAPRPDSAPAPGPDPGPSPAGGPVPGGRSRLGDAWVVLVSGAVVLVLLLVFILQNSQRVEVHLYGGHWNVPLGVGLLMAAALGVLLVVVPVTGRIVQLRRAVRRAHQRAAELERTWPAAVAEPTAAPEPTPAPNEHTAEPPSV